MTTTPTASDIRRDQARRFAEQLGVDGDELYAAANAAWSNLNPQSTSWTTALSVAGVALRAAVQDREARS